MLYIDYSLPRLSRYLLFLDAPFRYSWRHLVLFFHARIIAKRTGVQSLSKLERRTHFLIAFFEIVPLFGYLIAFLDWLFYHRPFRFIVLGDMASLATQAKEEIHFLINKVLPIYEAIGKAQGKDSLHEAKKLQAFIPKKYLQEMKELAQATNLSYEQILTANTIVDTLALFGCSICAVCKEPLQHEFATNYFHSLGRGQDVRDIDRSFWRYDEMLKLAPKPSIRALRKMLHKVNYMDTINSIIFDANTLDIWLAVGGDRAANRPYRHFSSKKLFGTKALNASNRAAKLARNLDWPMGLLGPLTALIVRKATDTTFSFATVGWAPLLGSYSGMNARGLSLAASIVPTSMQTGMPNQFLFRKILEEAENLAQAQAIIQNCQVASGMNLVIAAPDGILKAELDPARKKVGASTLTIQC